MVSKPMEWSQIEVEATAADYLHMLFMELSGQSDNKSAHRKLLLGKLNNRPEGAIERKHQNMTAVGALSEHLSHQMTIFWIS